MSIESRANWKYPLVVGDSKENDTMMEKRQAYIRGAEEERMEVAKRVCLMASAVYDFFGLVNNEINKDKFLEGFRNIVYDN